MRNAIEEKISATEVKDAIFASATGKSPGPDGLPAEFYREFAPELGEALHGVITEAMSAGELPESLRQGDIILLYKKGDPEEIRNYRPITLLNVDYKIFSRIITNRLKQAVRSLRSCTFFLSTSVLVGHLPSSMRRTQQGLEAL